MWHPEIEMPTLMEIPYAHSHPESPGDSSCWEPLFTSDCPALQGGACTECERMMPSHGHLNKVAWQAAEFAAGMFGEGSDEAQVARKWSYLAGLWHDLGKFAPEWQAYLRAKTGVDLEADEAAGTVDHSTAGSQHAVARHPILGHLLAYSIQGHHAGLGDTVSEGASLEKRLHKEVPGWSGAPEVLLDFPFPELPRFVAAAVRDGWAPAFFARMLFSCLVDADFLATEAFMNPDQAALRPRHPKQILQEMLALLDRNLAGFGPAKSEVDVCRQGVLRACCGAADSGPGLFSLTVPTGGGKTLSSLAFALRHALRNGQRRVIYVVPFTSIIEQNAAVFRDIFSELELDGAPVVLEHHSNLSPARETTQSRLASENWDARLVVTTAVQFYESFYAARTSSSRKLHRIANSVVVLDEAQCLPVDYLRPCLEVLKTLSSDYGTSAVVCTATQPALARGPRFPIGIEAVREIVPDPENLYSRLKRVDVVKRGRLQDAELAGELADSDRVLAIVNTRGHARKLFQELPGSNANFHLSASMCPAHRRQVLAEIRRRLDAGDSARLISTQVVEAGVDVDFPVVYRAMAGIDSIAQAAGRCNRNGKLDGKGKTHVFASEHENSERFFRETAQIAEQVLELHEDALGLDAVRRFFELYYLQHRPAEGQPWDRKEILGKLQCGAKRELPFLFQYRTVANAFQLIESDQVGVIIPFDDTARRWIAELRNPAIPLHREMLRGLQPYTVQIYASEFRKHAGEFEPLRDGQFYLLICPELRYSNDFGLNLEDASQTALMV